MDVFKNKEILVTGGAGFLGSNLCKRLLDLGAKKVICLDNMYTGKMKNIIPLKADNRFSFVEHDIIEPIDIKTDYIFHFACPASPPYYQKEPIFTTKTSVLGAINVLDLAKKYGSRVMLSSTSEVYGDPKRHPQTEDYRGHVNPIGIRACYDEGKRCAESLFFDYHRMHNVDIKVIRIFNTYGPNMDPMDGRVVSNFILQALQNKPITMYGDGKQTRSFCYVDDLIEGIMRMMAVENFIGPVNIGNPHEYNLLELAKEIVAITKSTSLITFHPLPQDDPCKRCPDISLAKEKFDWEPKILLHEGLTKTVAYYAEYLEEQRAAAHTRQQAAA